MTPPTILRSRYASKVVSDAEWNSLEIGPLYEDQDGQRFRVSQKTITIPVGGTVEFRIRTQVL